MAGRPPELLGHRAQALYFAGGQQWMTRPQALTDEVPASDPQEAARLMLADRNVGLIDDFTVKIGFDRSRQPCAMRGP